MIDYATDVIEGIKRDVLDRMNLTSKERDFAVREFWKVWNEYFDSDPIARMESSDVGTNVMAAVFAMMMCFAERTYQDAKRNIESERD